MKPTLVLDHLRRTDTVLDPVGGKPVLPLSRELLHRFL